MNSSYSLKYERRVFGLIWKLIERSSSEIDLCYTRIERYLLILPVIVMRYFKGIDDKRSILLSSIWRRLHHLYLSLIFLTFELFFLWRSIIHSVEQLHVDDRIILVANQLLESVCGFTRSFEFLAYLKRWQLFSKFLTEIFIAATFWFLIRGWGLDYSRLLMPEK